MTRNEHLLHYKAWNEAEYRVPEVDFLKAEIATLLTEQDKEKELIEKKANDKLQEKCKELDKMAQEFITKKLEQEGKMITEHADKYAKLLEDASHRAVEAKRAECDKEIEKYKQQIADLEERLDFKERVLDKIPWDEVIEAENEVYDELGIPEEAR